MEPVHYGVLAELDPPALVAAFAHAYEDYLMPLRFGDERLRLHVEAHDIVLEHSPLLRDAEGSFVGMAMLGVRGARGWIGGFGLATRHRGGGLSHGLCAEVVARARALGLAQLQLEVIDANARAIATYARAGFVSTRVLCSYRHDPAETVRGAEAELVELDIDGFPWSRSSATPAWQRERASVLRMPGLAAVACGDAASILSVTEASVSVQVLATDDEGAVDRLLGALASRYRDRPILMMNEPEGSPAERALARAGWTTFVRQREMVLALDG